MDNNYLNNYSKEQLESFIETLNKMRSNPNYSYQPYFMATKGTSKLETLDARARLGTVETMEYLDDLESRVSAIEEAANSGSGVSAIPTGRLVVKGKQLIDNPGSDYKFWVKEPVYDGNNIYAVITNGGLGLAVSYNNGGTFKSLSLDDLQFSGIQVSGDYAERLFRCGEIVFFDNKFFIYAPYGLDYAHPKIFSTTDFKTLTLVNVTNNFSSESCFLVLNDDLFIFDNRQKQLFKYNSDTSSFEHYGQTSYTLDVDKADISNRVVNFNNAIYFIDSNQLCKMSADYLNADNAMPDTELYGAFRLGIVNNNIIISDQAYVYYSADGENWNNVCIPHGTTDQRIAICTAGGIDIKYNEADGLYYGMISAQKLDDFNGVYCWENLSEEPEAITPNDNSFKSPMRSNNTDVSIKKCLGKIYFLVGGTLYSVLNKEYKEIVKLGSDYSTKFGYSGYIVQMSDYSSWFVESIGDRLLITRPNGSEPFLEVPLYALQSYNGTGTEDNTITVIL